VGPARIVIDTNVLVAALRSRRGAAFKLLSLVGRGDFDFALSVPLVLEYEAAAKRQARVTALSAGEIDDILDYLCIVGDRRSIFFLWRPFLKDPKDDMVLELAVEAECESIVTYNQRDFAGADRFGVRIVTPREFLQERGLLR
jgi:putative PIN family toxin of toxin-antitoxin system